MTRTELVERLMEWRYKTQLYDFVKVDLTSILDEWEGGRDNNQSEDWGMTLIEYKRAVEDCVLSPSYLTRDSQKEVAEIEKQILAALAKPKPLHHDREGNGGPSACRWCVNKDLTCLVPSTECKDPLFGPDGPAPESVVPKEPGRYRMSVEVKIQECDWTDHRGGLICRECKECEGTAYYFNGEKYCPHDIPDGATFYKIEEEK